MRFPVTTERSRLLSCLLHGTNNNKKNQLLFALLQARDRHGRIMPYNSLTISQSERALHRLQTQAM